VKALANKEVGDYLNEHFVSTFQKVGTFRLVNGQKQGGNVASYFCTPDGGILEAVAGPVDAPTLLRVGRYKQVFRMAHVEQLPNNPAVASVDWARIPFFPATAAAMTDLLQRQPLARTLDQQGRVHLLLACYPLVKLDQAYKVIYDDIVGEQVSTRPVNDGNTPWGLAPARPSWGCGGGGGGASAGSPWASVPRGPAPNSSPLLGGFPPPSPDDRREQDRLAALHRACDNVTPTEVCSGRPLNLILDDLRKRPAGPGPADDSPALGADVLAHLNVIAGGSDADFGLLRDGGKLRWPIAWQDAPLDEPSRPQRAALEADIQKALVGWKTGHPSANLLGRLRHEEQSLDRLLGQDIRDLAPSSYVAAKKYLTELGAAIRLLGRDDAAGYVNGEYALNPHTIHTVRDLVTFMDGHGLKFAAAVGGDEPAYAALHRALASYDERQAPPDAAVDRGAL
jgi:hypothetical protein